MTTNITGLTITSNEIKIDYKIIYRNTITSYCPNDQGVSDGKTGSDIERILAFKKHTKKNIQLSFISSRMYIAVPYHKNLFEPKLFGDIVNFDHIKDYHNDLSLVLDLVNTLNLNTRIKCHVLTYGFENIP